MSPEAKIAAEHLSASLRSSPGFVSAGVGGQFEGREVLFVYVRRGAQINVPLEADGFIVRTVRVGRPTP